MFCNKSLLILITLNTSGRRKVAHIGLWSFPLRRRWYIQCPCLVSCAQLLSLVCRFRDIGWKILWPSVFNASVCSDRVGIYHDITVCLIFGISMVWTLGLLYVSDVKRGQSLEAKAKAEDKSLRTRTMTRTNLRGRGRGRGQSFETEDKFEARKSCVKQIKPVSVQHHQKYSPHH